MALRSRTGKTDYSCALSVLPHPPPIATGCQRKRSANMRRGLGLPRRTALGITAVSCGNTLGIGKTPATARIQWGSSSPMRGGCMRCMAMCGNGCRIGTMPPITRGVWRKIQEAQRGDDTRVCGAARGATTRGAPACPSASDAALATAAASSVFGVPTSWLFWVLSAGVLDSGNQGLPPLVEFLQLYYWELRPTHVPTRHERREGVVNVMPAQAGIQESQTGASDYSAWIPAFAGMTHLRFAHYLYCVGLLKHPLYGGKGNYNLL